jgi:hypothetical protein
MADPPHLRFLLVFVSSASTRANEVQTCGFAFNKIIDSDWFINFDLILSGLIRKRTQIVQKTAGQGLVFE